MNHNSITNDRTYTPDKLMMSDYNPMASATVPHTERILRDSVLLDDDLCNQESPKSTTIKRLSVGESQEDMFEKMAALEQMNKLLENLKQRFGNQTSINKDEFTKLFETEFKFLVANLKSENATFQTDSI